MNLNDNFEPKPVWPFVVSILALTGWLWKISNDGHKLIAERIEREHRKRGR